MQILVRTLGGQTITVSIGSQQSIDQVKVKIQEHLGIPPDEQLLKFAGQLLEDDRATTHYHIQDQSTLELVLRVQGGTRKRREK